MAQQPVKTKQELMDEFDPNDPSLGEYEWATFKPGYRKGAFKLHRTRGPALTACTREPYYILYRWNTTLKEWVEVCRVEDRRHRSICAECGKDVATNSHYSPLSWFWIEQPTLREVGFCGDCLQYGSTLDQMVHAPIPKRIHHGTNP